MSIASRIEAIEQHLTDDYSVLTLAGADLTNVDKNILNLKLTWQERLLYFMNNGTQEVWDNWEKVVGEGTTITLNNTEEAPMKIVLKGNTSQETTTQSANLFDEEYYNNDSLYSINAYKYTKLTRIKERGTLYFKAQLKTGKSEIGSFYLCLSNRQNPNTMPNNTAWAIHGTIVADGSTIQRNYATFDTSDDLYFAFYPAKVAVDTIFDTYDFLISTDNISYVPFVPDSPNPDYPQDIHVVSGDNSIVVSNSDNTQSQSYHITLPEGTELCKIGEYQDKIDKSSGKNLFDKDNPTIPNADMSYGQIISKNDTNCWFFEVDTNKTYTLTKQSYNYGYIGYSNTKPVIGTNLSNRNSIANETTITINPTDKYLCIFISKSDNLDIIQLEEGTATSYEPYGTVWYLNKQIGKVVLNGSETWVLNESGTGYVRFTTTESDLISTSVSDVAKYFVISDRFVSSTSNQTVNANADKNRVCAVTNNRLLFKTLDTSLSTAQLWKTWLSTNNVEVRYVLNTPTYTEITDSTLLSQLNALAKSYNSQTNISQENNDLASILNATALREMA